MADDSSTAPAWVRPSFLYLVCLIGTLVMIWGGITFARGAVTAALPRTDDNPITSIANAIADVVDEVAADFAGPDEFEEVAGVLGSLRSAIDKQARNRGVGQIVTGIVIFAAGLVAFLLAYRQVTPGRREPAAVAPYGGPYTPAGQQPYQQYPGAYTPPPSPQPGPPPPQ